MRISNTSARLKELMSFQNLKQIDILRKAKPYCDEFNIKLGKSDLSQFVNGKSEPGSSKLGILSMALDVNEAWLMGYDIPMTRTETPHHPKSFSHITTLPSTIPPDYCAQNKTERQLLDDFRRLNDEGQEKASSLLSDLVATGRYKKTSEYQLNAQKRNK